MLIRDLFLPEYDMELATTRKLVAAVPDDKLAWRPHDKSMTLQYLVSHLVNIPAWVPLSLDHPELDMAPEGKKWETPQMASRAEALAALDANGAAGRASLAAADDARMEESWSLKAGGQVYFTCPKRTVMRNFVMNHLIHHRAQLGVYLRLLDVPLPGSYGPSADEAMG